MPGTHPAGTHWGGCRRPLLIGFLGVCLLASVLSAVLAGPVVGLASPSETRVPDLVAGSMTDQGNDLSNSGRVAAAVWTVERMDAAVGTEAEAVGVISLVPSIRRDPWRATPARGNEGQREPATGAAILEAGRAGFDYPAPFTAYQLTAAEAKQRHNRPVGVLFYKDSTGAGHRCTASVVNKYVLVTAAHCIWRGSWFKDFSFCPAYNGAEATVAARCPYGQWTWQQVGVVGGWKPDQNYSFDVGFVLLRKNGAGKGIGEVVGWLGFATGQGTIHDWTELAYPGEAPFDGQSMWLLHSSYAYDIDWEGMGGPNAIGVGGNFTGGASGAPLILDYRSNAWVNGVHSGHRGVVSEEVNFSYFGQAVWAKYKQYKALVP